MKQTAVRMEDLHSLVMYLDAQKPVFLAQMFYWLKKSID